MSDNLRATLHAYRFNLAIPTEATAYSSLVARLELAGLKKFATISSRTKGSRDFEKKIAQLDGQTVEIDGTFLFSDQWNTKPIADISDAGMRLMGWNEDIFPNPQIKEGYWLDRSSQMLEAIRNRNACGYCGRQEAAQKGNVFCGACIDSPYLKESELYLTRMQSVALGMKARAPLSGHEADLLVPEYRQAQIYGASERGKARIKKERADIETKYARATANAKAEHDGLLWLMDHGIKLDNVIFYDHTSRFGFGWRQPVSEAFKSDLLDIISEFPFPYDIVTEGGRKLSGD